MTTATTHNMPPATLTFEGKEYELPVYEPSIGPKVVDIAKLYGSAGIFTYDPGFTSTANCESKITYVDGDNGILLYRGYPIEDLVENADFLEVSYLLLYRELPTPAQKKEFDSAITYHTMLHEQMSRQGKALMLSGVQPAVMRMLERSKLDLAIGRDHIYWSSDQAIIAAESFYPCPVCMDQDAGDRLPAVATEAARLHSAAHP